MREMKARYLIVAGVAVAAMTTLACQTATEPAGDAISFSRGNGAPSGSHYNLNIIGVPKGKSIDGTGSSGHRIFVNLEGNTRIDLERAQDFAVTDYNGTDGRAAFQLPAPCPEGSTFDAEGFCDTVYSVYVRALGKPGGSSSTTTCAAYTDPVTEVTEEYCSTENLIVIRAKGKSTFTKADRYLLYLYVDLDGDGVSERYPIFDEALQDYYWSYDNNGLKLLQMRFYYNN